jgi:MYXO-CTERM domain-containing protein
VNGEICTNDVIYGDGGTGSCVPGCLQDSDCPADGGAPVCATCQEVCIAAGNTSAHIGDGCASAADCPTGASCTTRRFDGGYCTEPCVPEGTPGAAQCACPSDSTCQSYGRSGLSTTECLLSCTNPGGPCPRPGYLCQPLAGGLAACLPPCTLRTFGGSTTPTDTCTEYGANNTFACDLDSGYCGGPAQVVDAGPDAGPVAAGDAGPADAGTPADAGQYVSPITTTPKSGCGCAAGTGTPEGFLTLLGLVALGRRRRRA